MRQRFFLSADYSRGFGGKYGIDKDKVDKSAVGFEYQGRTEKHESQKGGLGLSPLPSQRLVARRAMISTDTESRARPAGLRADVLETAQTDRAVN